MKQMQNILHRGAVVSWLLLLVLCVAWELWLAPLRPHGSLLVLKAIPLLFPLRGLVRANHYTMQWSSMLVLVYLLEGIVRAMTDTGLSAVLADLEVGLVVVNFLCTIFYLRPVKKAAQARRRQSMDTPI